MCFIYFFIFVLVALKVNFSLPVSNIYDPSDFFAGAQHRPKLGTENLLTYLCDTIFCFFRNCLP